MQIVADLHTHTIASTHAYSTLREMVGGAARQGLCALAITDHGSDMQDAPHEWHFSNLDVIPPVIDGVRVLRGIEFNICEGGRLDQIRDHCLRHIEFALASFHEPCFVPQTAAVHTEALEAVLQNPRVHAFGHLGNPKFAFDYEHIISKCNEYGKIVEINSNSFVIRKGSPENCAKIARLCRQYEVPIAVNSDAHIEFSVGQVSHALEMLREIDFPEELVINSSKARLAAYFKGRGIALFE